MTRRPIIAVTGPDRGGIPAWLFTSWAIRIAGGRPTRVTPNRGAPPHFDALIVGGGADVCPARYDEREQRPHAEDHHRTRTRGRLWLDYLVAPLIYAVRWMFGLSRKHAPIHDHARDELELAMLARAEAVDVPVLGICRGAQLLNVHAGGTLHRNLESFYTEAPNPWTVFPRKQVDIDVHSRLFTALRTRAGDVNSLHHQAIDRVGRGLRVVARDHVRVVQAIEHVRRPFWIGVQWHPEYLPQVAEQRRLLRAVVRCAAAS